jgi:endonuclease/exonuclease/phosphatase family metal-dependent hydrolase
MGMTETKLITLLGWNVKFQTAVSDILGHIETIQKEHGALSVLCLQEVPSYDFNDPEKEVKTIADKLGMQYHFALSGKPYRALFGGKEKIICHGLAILSAYPIVPESKQTYNLRKSIRPKRMLRKLITVQIAIPGRKDLLTVGDFHMSPFDFLRRMNEAKTLSNLLRDCDIAFGDANSSPNSRYIKRILATHPRIDDNTAEHTFFTPIGPYKFGPFKFHGTYSSRLDYVVGKVKTEEAKILDSGPSDHKPLLVKIRV